MKKVVRWTLPSIPYPFYLQKLLSRDPHSVFYFKYIIDKIGNLDVGRNEVKEWSIPNLLFPAIGVGNMQNICFGPTNTIWGTLQNAHQLFQLQLYNNLVTCYGSVSGKPGSTNFTAYPFPYPNAICCDISGRIWYSGSAFRGVHTLGTVIGCFDPKSKDVELWEMDNIPLITISELLVDVSANVVWCSLYHTQPNALALAPVLGKLDLLQNDFTLWSYPQQLSPFPGITGTRAIASDDSKQIWLAYENAVFGPHSIIRVDVPTLQFHEYIQQASPITVKVQRNFSKGLPWFSMDGGQLSMISDLACGVPTNPSRSTIPLKLKKYGVTSKELHVDPFVSPVETATIQVSERSTKCNYEVPSSFFSWCDLALSEKGFLYFSERSGVHIGAFEA